MTDLEITRLCAEALGWKHLGAVGVPPPADKNDVSGLWCLSGGNDWWVDPQGFNICAKCSGIPDPLHDDAMAMALVKKLKLSCGWDYDGLIWCETQTAQPYIVIRDAVDLNRAICECVAKMQAAKQ